MLKLVLKQMDLPVRISETTSKIQEINYKDLWNNVQETKVFSELIGFLVTPIISPEEKHSCEKFGKNLHQNTTVLFFFG